MMEGRSAADQAERGIGWPAHLQCQHIGEHSGQCHSLARHRSLTGLTTWQRIDVRPLTGWCIYSGASHPASPAWQPHHGGLGGLGGLGGFTKDSVFVVVNLNTEESISAGMLYLVTVAARRFLYVSSVHCPATAGPAALSQVHRSLTFELSWRMYTVRSVAVFCLCKPRNKQTGRCKLRL
ncbi:hypothetical protein BGW36DRAFT_112842 [Talaromyces proteolyticus]|uniref:Uncharacterized protein n=1 Tax=Talaromyces proteolyticus TaxID=1131652 RepID=A0AAD4Q3Y2_9EURO|nr:uncharacterized protein BGW36DRAFT_112842 [Talaromyces proteolyticus]KAH8702186.1 hypothetical protein BGW36DRAFT_112842 [Talaromyces proteolyticus]